MTSFWRFRAVARLLGYSNTNDQLYLYRGGRGYGASCLEKESIVVLNSDEMQYTISIDCYYYESYECTYRVAFERVDGKWIISEYEIQ